MAHVAFLGAGLLGAGFVEAARRRGLDVVVWNRTRAKAEALTRFGAVVADSPAEAVRGAERVHLVLAEDDAVDSVIAACGDALTAPIIDHSTNHPGRVAERVARLDAAGVSYLHAPVFMAPSNAQAGTGLMLVSGAPEKVAAAREALQAMTGTVWELGERPDLAATYKLSGNAMLIGVVGLLGDVFQMCKEQGVPQGPMLELFTKLNPGNAIPFRGKRALERRWEPASFELAMARKDVRLMIEAAGGPEGLCVLPGVAARMDAHLERGEGQLDFGVINEPNLASR